MSIKKVCCVAALAVLPLVSQAATPSIVFEKEFLGQGTNDSILTAQNLGALTSTGFSVIGSRMEELPGGTSLDYFSFSLTESSIVSFALTTPGGGDYSNDPLVGLFSNTGVLLDYNDDSNGSYNSFLSRTLSSGQYYVAVTGYSDFEFVGEEGASTNWPYVLTLTSVPAVPEPESFAMMLAGLGLMGSIARRRSKAKSV